MKLTDVYAPAVAARVRELNREFHTLDVSQAEAVRQAHAVYLDERSYNSVIGRYLSNRRAELHLALIGHRHPRGARWVG